MVLQMQTYRKALCFHLTLRTNKSQSLCRVSDANGSELLDC